MRKIVLAPLLDLSACLERLAEVDHPFRRLLISVVALIVTWFVYVPIHELLHVLGCVAAGGSVSELQIAPQYGGTLLARWFDFVVPGGDYAGRLSGFDWKGSDVIYLATDFAPYLLTVLIGVPMLKMCARRPRPLLLGAAIVIALAPFYNVIGDYFEMGSIVSTRGITIAAGSEAIVFASLRSDDVFKLIGTLVTEPATLQLADGKAVALAGVVILVSLLLAVFLAVCTYALGDGFSRLVCPSAPAARGDPRTSK